MQRRFRVGLIVRFGRKILLPQLSQQDTPSLNAEYFKWGTSQEIRPDELSDENGTAAFDRN